MNGETVLQAVRAARVFGDVAADRADLLTRRIRCVVVAVRRNLLRDLEVRDAGFHGDAPIGNVNVEDAIEPGETDDDAARNRQCATGESRSVAARDEGHAFSRAQTHHRLYLRG